MSQIKLKRLLTKQPLNRALIEALDANVCIEDANGGVLLGDLPAPASSRYPVQVGDTVIGWVSGGQRAESVARLLMQLGEQEAENTELADAILDLYREVNLLYELADKLAAALELDVIARVVISEVSRIITVDHTLVILSTDGKGLRFLPSSNENAPAFTLSEAFVRQLLATNKAEIVNDPPQDARWADAAERIASFIYTPLKAKGRTLGLIVLASERPTVYRAADLKFLNTIAAQTAPAIDNALIYERTTREAAEREARLQQQIRELRIEIDEQRQRDKVAEITETDYFRAIRDQKDALRLLLNQPGD